MQHRGLVSAFTVFALIFIAGCATYGHMAAPNWQRYNEGPLAGFLQAPGESPTTDGPAADVRHLSGRIELADLNGRAADSTTVQTQRFEVVSTTGTHTPADGLSYVAELRGPEPSASVRTQVTRHGFFDFGNLPSGSYTLKTTVAGWRPAVTKVLLSPSSSKEQVGSVVLSQVDLSSSPGPVRRD